MYNTSRTDKSLYGIYRAKVVDNKDPQKFGRVRVWIPSIMPNIPDTKGLWARPANNPVGGRNTEFDKDHHYMGSSYIPKKGAYLWIFFESGDINKPYYMAACELENTMVLPENQLGSNYEDKWTILKTHKGRVIIISDDPDDERIEIAGKKRQINTPPTGDTNSVYQIDGNMTTILFDERSGKEKVLVRTVKGDFFHIDVDEQKLQIYFKNDIEIKTDGSFYLTANKNIDILAETGHISAESKEDMSLLTHNKLKTESDNDTSMISHKNLHCQTSDGNICRTSSKNIFDESADNINMKANKKMKLESVEKFNIKGAGVNSESTSGNIETKAKGKINIESESDINLKSPSAIKAQPGISTAGSGGTGMSIDKDGVMNIKAKEINAETQDFINMKINGDINITSDTGNVNLVANTIQGNGGFVNNPDTPSAGPAISPSQPEGAESSEPSDLCHNPTEPANPAIPSTPEGDRNT